MTGSYELTVHGLIRKRAELAGQVEALHIQLAGLMAQLHAIDTSIRVFRPAIDLEDLPDGVPPSPFTAFRGDFQRQLLEMLRASDRPLNTLELGEAVMERRGLNASDKIVCRLIARRVGYALCKMRRKGLVDSRRVGGRNGPMEWWLVGRDG